MDFNVDKEKLEAIPKKFHYNTKTHEKFISEVWDLMGDEYQVLSKYEQARIKVKVKHNKCGNVWKIIPASLLRGRGCPKCSRIKAAKKMTKTHKQFSKEVYDLVGDEYEALDEYKNTDKHMTFRHNTCSHEWLITPSNFLRGRRCPQCSLRKTHDQFVKEVYALVGNEYDVLENYTTAGNNILFRHNKCGHEYKARPSEFLYANRCPVCRYTKNTKTTKEFKEVVYDLVKDEYSVIGEYINSRTKVKLKHNKCNREYEVIPYSFIEGRRCPSCNHECMRKTNEEFLQLIKELVGEEYKAMSKYKKGTQKIVMMHVNCGHEWEVTPTNFINHGSRCPKCNESKGEKRISNYLKSLHYKYEAEYIINECRDITVLPFDFAVFDIDTLVCLIEYEGEQHYLPVKHWGGSEAFINVKIRMYTFDRIRMYKSKIYNNQIS